MNNRPKIATPSAMPGVQGIHQLGVGGAAESEARALVAQLRRELAAKTVDDFAEIGSAA
jgi:hypothetical protein